MYTSYRYELMDGARTLLGHFRLSWGMASWVALYSAPLRRFDGFAFFLALGVSRFYACQMSVFTALPHASTTTCLLYVPSTCGLPEGHLECSDGDPLVFVHCSDVPHTDRCACVVCHSCVSMFDVVSRASAFGPPPSPPSACVHGLESGVICLTCRVFRYSCRDRSSTRKEIHGMS